MKNCAESVRRAVYSSLVACSKHGKYPNLEISSQISKASFSDADRRLYTELVYGVTERAVTLDHIIAGLSSRPVSKIELETLTCLRIGIYQLLYLDRIPDHAAVCESVSLARKSSKSFVNAVLREFIRRGKKIELPPRENISEYLSVKYSCPEELCKFFISKFGKTEAENILLGTLKRLPVCIRVNTLKTSADELIKNVFNGGRISPLDKDIIELERAGFEAENNGRWFVQDAASRLAVLALDAKPGETVIDTCAAPGGKTFSIAVDMKNTGKIFSFDLHKNKISLIEKGAEKLGLDCVSADCRSAAEPKAELIGTADRVICDAPCSGLGVISKKPDIKYKSISDIERLPAVQQRILDGASKYVKPGGILVYSTCTVNPDENGGVVSSFLFSHPDFSPCDFSFENGMSSDGGMLTTYPYKTGCDGFFIAKMIRKD